MRKDLDWLAARTAQAIITNTKSQDAGGVDNLTTKALGVLQENGGYAGLLYLYSRSESEQVIAKQIRTQLLHLTSELSLSPPTDRRVGNELVVEDAKAGIALKFLTDNVCSDLDSLLLVKQIWEQTLIYARYGAKAREAEEKAHEDEAKARLAEEAKP